VDQGAKHGTIMVLTDALPVEVTTFRREGPYNDGRRPTYVEFHHQLEEDLARRDFTMNAMALDLESNAVEDPFDGQEAIRNRMIACVGDPETRFSEDGLRALRAVRFAGVLNFQIDAATAAA